MKKTVIQLTGCVKVSALCDNCYAERDSLRYGNDIFGADKERIFVKSVWSNLEKWNTQAGKDGVRRRCFVMSFGDFFESLKPDHPNREEMFSARRKAMHTMERLTNLEFLVLTKRISNVEKMVHRHWLTGWPAHIRLGISVGTQKDTDRDIPRLLAIDAPNFLSMEPLLERVDIKQHLKGKILLNPEDADHPFSRSRSIEWLITGGESGPGARVADPEWFRSLRDQCVAAGVPFHLKQITDHGRKVPMDQWPQDLVIQEFPR